MALRSHVNASRYEMKYLVAESCACGVRDFVRAHLHRDAHAIPELHHQYPNFTLYLDCPGLSLYSATSHGHKNRYKLRLRYYDQHPDTPVFFEIKRRVTDVIIKDRAAVRKRSVARLLAGACPRPGDLAEPENLGDYGVLRRFCELRAAIDARPKLVVYFEREAWVSSTDEQMRVTFDRASMAARYDGSLAPRNWYDTKFPGVILELKFTNRFP